MPLFAQTNYPINTTIVGPGTVVASPADTGNGYPSGTVVQLTATPSSRRYFQRLLRCPHRHCEPAEPLPSTPATSVTATFAATVITRDATSFGTSKGSAFVTFLDPHPSARVRNRAIVIAVGQTDTIASPDPSSVVTSVLFNGIYATPVPNSIVSGRHQRQRAVAALLPARCRAAAGRKLHRHGYPGRVGEWCAGGARFSFFGVQQGGPEAVITHRDTTGADLINTTPSRPLTNNAVVVDTVEDNNVAALTANTGQTAAWSGSASQRQRRRILQGGAPRPARPPLGWAGSASRLTPFARCLCAGNGCGGSDVCADDQRGRRSGRHDCDQSRPDTIPAGERRAAYGHRADRLHLYRMGPATTLLRRTRCRSPWTTKPQRGRQLQQRAPTCTLGLNIVGSGTVTPAAGTYNCGSVIHFVATPAAGYTFTSYSGDFSSPDNPADFTLSANANVTVEFDPVPICSLTLSTVGSGTVTPGSGNYACGTNRHDPGHCGRAATGSPAIPGGVNTTANPTNVQLNQNTSIVANFTAGTSAP